MPPGELECTGRGLALTFSEEQQPISQNKIIPEIASQYLTFEINHS